MAAAEEWWRVAIRVYLNTPELIYASLWLAGLALAAMCLVCRVGWKLRDQSAKVACTRFRRHRVRCFDGAGGGSWRDGSLPASSSLRLCA
jgi:hypothetical protein